MERKADVDRLYGLLGALKEEVGGMRFLKDCSGYMDWPDRGVYFFFSPEETRQSSDQLRLTRIGTHAVSEGSQTSLWNRLRTHRGAKRGSYEGGGNHRGSVFRKRVGEAIIERHGLHDEYPEWGEGSSAEKELRMSELELERRVSEYIRNLPFLWLEIDDEPGPESDRAFVERNAIALVSNFDDEPVDSRSEDWLGKHSPVDEIRESGLWNIDHVDEEYDPGLIDFLERNIDDTGAKETQSGFTKFNPNSGQESSRERLRNLEDDSFDDVWVEITEFAESERYVSTLSRGNDNEIRPGHGAIEVRNLDTDEWRKLNKADFWFVYEVIREKDRLTLDDIEPELAGRKSMVTAILAYALELDYDERPLTVYL